ncbi:prenylcysteine oxidase-like protein 1 precursor [Massariosphaeria phaeospora]|uniref:Prenylcysteine oxidase-like protein 1 n=1 Tax=Massariosphaeria phaeospora TaxID=100035 RepID=A0A7C8MK79_9PLEO|nr:prenylcysteine oxidase-like protein 1 precursor [Massariosphaeria phaeospora]
MRALGITLLGQLAFALRSGSNGKGNGALAEPEVAAKRVAVIGAGAGGSSTAYFLSQNADAAGIPVDISVFERGARVGGRCTTVNAWSDPAQPVELGASIFVDVNRILVDAAEKFDLSTASMGAPRAEGAAELGVWDGKQFLVKTSDEDGWWQKAKLLWRYGLAPIKTNSLMKSTVAKFLTMYAEPVFPWKSLNEVVHDVGLADTMAMTGLQFLTANGIGEKFAHEIIQASTRVNYAQNLKLIHGLETMVCMATSGAMSIAGGNYQIFDRMLESSSSISTHLNTSVTKISKQSDNTYNLTTSSGEISSFDDVVLATPLQFASIEIDPAPEHVPDEIPYVEMFVTLFASPHRLDPKAFNLEAGKQVPNFVLTTLPDGEDTGSDPNGVGTPGFWSISIIRTGLNPHGAPSPENIYKIFAPKPAGAKLLSHILGKYISDDEAEHGSRNGAISWIHHKTWHSYPYEYPRVTFDEISLDDGLWYTSSIESFISTMETSALAGKNVAKLIVDRWQGMADGEIVTVQSNEEWGYTGLKGQHQRPLEAEL